MKKFLAISTILIASGLYAQDYKSFPMWDTKLPVEKRVSEVVSRLTLEEKVARKCLMPLLRFRG